MPWIKTFFHQELASQPEHWEEYNNVNTLWWEQVNRLVYNAQLCVSTHSSFVLKWEALYGTGALPPTSSSSTLRYRKVGHYDCMILQADYRRNLTGIGEFGPRYLCTHCCKQTYCPISAGLATTAVSWKETNTEQLGLFNVFAQPSPTVLMILYITSWVVK